MTEQVSVLRRDTNTMLLINGTSGAWAECTEAQSAALLGTIDGWRFNDWDDEEVRAVGAAMLKRVLLLGRSVKLVTPEAIVPNIVYLSVTNRCNLHCQYCFANAGGEQSVLSLDQWKHIINEIASFGVRAVCFTGGEPFLQRDTISLMEFARASGLGVRVITNGVLVNPELAVKIGSLCSRATVSLDSYFPSVNDSLRSPGAFRGAVAAIMALLDAGCQVGISTVVTRVNVSELENIIMFARLVGIALKDIVLNVFIPLGRGHGRNLCCSLQEIRDLRSRVFSAVQTWYSGALPHNLVQSIQPYPGFVRVRCGAGYAEVSVGADGRLFPCRLLHDDSLGSGPVHQVGFVNALRSVQELVTSEMSASTERSGCNSCPIRLICGGGCRAGHYAFSSDVDRNSEYWCETLRDEFVEILWHRHDSLLEGVSTWDSACRWGCFEPTYGTCWAQGPNGDTVVANPLRKVIQQLNPAASRVWSELVSGKVTPQSAFHLDNTLGSSLVQAGLLRRSTQ